MVVGYLSENGKRGELRVFLIFEIFRISCNVGSCIVFLSLQGRNYFSFYRDNLHNLASFLFYFIYVLYSCCCCLVILLIVSVIYLFFFFKFVVVLYEYILFHTPLFLLIIHL